MLEAKKKLAYQPQLITMNCLRLLLNLDRTSVTYLKIKGIIVEVVETERQDIESQDSITVGKKGKLAPSIQHKIDSHLTIINEVYSILPINRLNIEGGEFDPHKLKNPDIQGAQYQNGESKGFYNVKQAVLHRDNYTCQLCLKKDTKLQVHHIIYKSKGGSNRMDNLVTLCKHCHQKIHNEDLKFDKKSNHSNTQPP